MPRDVSVMLVKPRNYDPDVWIYSARCRARLAHSVLFELLKKLTEPSKFESHRRDMWLIGEGLERDVELKAGRADMAVCHAQ
jgi:hypothetical protein